MNCQGIQNILPLYSGGDLTRWRRIIVKHHLHRCENCRKELATLQRTRSIVSDALRQRAATESHDRFWEEVLFRLPKEKIQLKTSPPTEKRTPSTFHKLAPACIGFVLIVLMILMGEKRPPHDQNLKQVKSISPHPPDR